MSQYGSQVAVDDTDVSMSDTLVSPSGATLTGNIVRGFSVDTGAAYANYQAKNTLVGGLTPFI
jgi:hypothetical protein